MDQPGDMDIEATLEKRGIVSHDRVLRCLVHCREVIYLIRSPLLDYTEHLIPARYIDRTRFNAFRRTRRAASQAEDCTPVGCKPIEKNASILSRTADDEGPSHAG